MRYVYGPDVFSMRTGDIPGRGPARIVVTGLAIVGFHNHSVASASSRMTTCLPSSLCLYFSRRLSSSACNLYLSLLASASSFSAIYLLCSSRPNRISRVRSSRRSRVYLVSACELCVAMTRIPWTFSLILLSSLSNLSLKFSTKESMSRLKRVCIIQSITPFKKRKMCP